MDPPCFSCIMRTMDQPQTSPHRRWTPYRIATTTILFVAFLFLLYSVRDQGRLCTSDAECHLGQKCGSVADGVDIVGQTPFDKTCQSFVRKWVVF